MLWQDWAISIGNLILALALIPSVISRDKPSVWTSLITACVLVVFGFAFYTLGLLYSAVVVVITALIWGLLLFQKMSQTK